MTATILNPQDLSDLTLAETLALIHDWPLWARQNQLPPDHPSHPNPNSDWETWMALAGRGFGKQLPLHTPIPTTRGWKTVGTLTLEDILFDESGAPTRILKIHPISTPPRAYRIHFNDHTHIDACSEHLWVTWPHSALKAYSRDHSPSSFPQDWPVWKKPRSKAFASAQAQVKTLTTQEIYETQHRMSHHSPHANHGIPCTLPLRLPHADLPIDPYLLGYWLGNGSSSSSTICCHSQDLDWLMAQIPGSIRTRTNDPLPNRAHFKVPHITGELTKLNLKDNKHIPPGYLRASLDQRLALVQGFMDADGHIPQNRAVRAAEISQVKHHLADQLKELLHSLGYYVTEAIKVPTIQGVPKSAVKLLKFTPREEMNPFRIPRKAQLVIDPPTQRIRTRYRRIIKVTPIAPTPMRCITVDSPYAMYLAGTQMVPTHNTRMGAEQVLRWVDQGYRRIHIIAPTTADTRDVIVDGDSGILSVAHPSKRPVYEPSKRRLTFPSGAIALLFSAEEPERLRGPQCDACWMDEMASWQYAQETYDQAMFGLRLGRHPQLFISTTPRPIPLVRSIIAQSQKDPIRTVVTTGSTYENKANLAPIFFGKVAQYEGTRLGRQELHAEVIDPTETGIIKGSWFKRWPALTASGMPMPLPPFEHIVQSYDTAYSEKSMDKKTKEPDPTAATTWGVIRLTSQLMRDLDIPDIPAPPFEYIVLLLDAWSDHLAYPELRRKVVAEYDDTAYSDRKADTVLIENKGSGTSLLQDLQRVVPIRPYNPGRDSKIERMHAISHIPCNALVYIPESKANPGEHVSWAKAFIEEVTTFPLSPHDDFGDTFSQAMSFLIDLGFLSIDSYSKDDVVDYVKRRQNSNPYSK